MPDAALAARLASASTTPEHGDHSMADDAKQSIERYVASALRARAAASAASGAAAREEILAAFAKLEAAISDAGGDFSLPEELIPAPTPVAAPPPAASEVGLTAHVLSAQRELLSATDQVGLLTQLLLVSTVSCSRVAFFIVKKDSLPFGDDTIVGAACSSGKTVRGRAGDRPKDSQFLSRLGGDMPRDAMAVPIWIRDKVAAVLYGDCGNDEQILDPEVPEILAIHAGLCLETLATRQKSPRPKGTEGSGPQAPISPSAPAATAAPVSASGPIPVTGMTPPATERSAPQAPAPLPAPAAAPPAPAPSRTAVAAPAPPPPMSPQVIAAPAAPVVSLDHLPDEERKLHEEARRFARLLVSEIVLYNERQVEEGRRQKDLYERLKEDIDRSRGMYDQRVNAKVRAATNYFLQELVRTLANGDESAIRVPWA